MNRKSTVFSSNLTNKYNPQEPTGTRKYLYNVQILPINTILKNQWWRNRWWRCVQILPINTILKNQVHLRADR